MNLNQIHNVYFIGIGGIGMSALARYFQYIGKNVAGYDKTETQLTDELQALGLAIHFEDNINLIPKDFYAENTLVVVTPAVPVSHSEWNYFVEREYTIKKRAEADNIELIALPVNTSADVQLVTQSLLSNQIEVFFANPDNTVFSSFETIVKSCTLRSNRD